MPLRTSLNDTRQGSAWAELVLYPTLAPHLAPPYHVPGTPEYIEAQAQLNANAQPNASGADQSAGDSEDDQSAGDLPDDVAGPLGTSILHLSNACH